MIRCKLILSVVMLLGLLAGRVQLAHGHFVWIAKDAKTGETKIFFGEGPEPDQKKFLKGVAKLKTWQLQGDEFAATSMELREDGDEGWFVAKTNKGCAEFAGDVTYGVFSKGESSMLLHYCAQYGSLQTGNSLVARTGSVLPLSIVAGAKGKKIRIRVLAAGKRAAECELVIVDSQGKTHEVKTNAKGLFAMDKAAGRYLIRAKEVDSKAGKYEGKDYSEKRTYCTLVLDVDGQATVATANTKAATVRAKIAQDDSDAKKFADIPLGLTSFGGAIANNKLYVYGGHIGKAHSYYESGQNKTLYELDLHSQGEWKSVAKGLGLQGLAMVSHKGKLYRLGGFHAHNKEGEKHDLRSVKDFAVFDFAKKQWQQLEPMPEGRSSFDAVVIQNSIYVVGGWAMKGTEGIEWSQTAIKFDLSNEKSKWETLPEPPFKRRALSVGFQGDKLVAVGGMQQKGGPTKKVSLFDLNTGKWSDGPELPGDGRMEGFGSSCFNVGGQMVASTYGGNVYKLAEDFSKWVVISKLEEGRFFHRLLPLNDKEFVLVGGASMETGKFYELEVLSK